MATLPILPFQGQQFLLHFPLSAPMIYWAESSFGLMEKQLQKLDMRIHNINRILGFHADLRQEYTKFTGSYLRLTLSAVNEVI